MKYMMRAESELNLDTLGKILALYQTNEVPKMNKYNNYYKGKMEICYKVPTDEGKPCNKVVVNFARNIVDNYAGYMAGKDITYSSSDDIEPILDVLKYNDVHSEDVRLLVDGLVYGKAVELNYIDEDAKQRFKAIPPTEAVDIYDDTLNENLLYAVRFYREDAMDERTESYFVEVYDKWEIRKYRSTAGFTSFQLLEQRPHYFNQVPMSFFYLDEHTQECIFAQIMSMNDAYNNLLSGEVDSFDAFADAYLVMKGVSADEDDLLMMKRQRAFAIDSDADVSYLTKNVSDTQIENMLDRLSKQIHTISCSPDFTDESFMAQSGEAIKYKLIGFENKAGAIEANMRKLLQKRIELICSILYLKGGEEVWRDIDINFKRNLPNNLVDVASVVNQFRGLVSTKTLLGQIPFVSNVDEEMEMVQAEKEANMSMYNFGNSSEEPEDEEETTNEE